MYYPNQTLIYSPSQRQIETYAFFSRESQERIVLPKMIVSFNVESLIPSMK